MTAQLVVGGADRLFDTVRSLDAEPSVEGIGIFAADGELPDPADLNPVLRDLDTQVFGGMFPEVVYEGERRSDAVVVATLPVEPTVTLVPDLGHSAGSFDRNLPETVPDGGTAFVLVDAFADRVEDLVSTLFHSYGVDLNYIGGGAGSLDMEQRPCLVTNAGVVENAAVVATVDIPTSIGVKHGWNEVAGPFRVTAAEGRTLVELDGDPAFDVYREVVENDADVDLTPDSFFEVAKMYPFGISRLDGERIVRDPFEVDGEGALDCFGNVPEGEFVHILRGDPESLVGAAAEAYETATGGADGEVLFFDCISRVLYLEDDFSRELDAVGGSESPAFGALTLGEIANDGTGHLDFYNKTAVTAVLDGV